MHAPTLFDCFTAKQLCQPGNGTLICLHAYLVIMGVNGHEWLETVIRIDRHGIVVCRVVRITVGMDSGALGRIGLLPPLWIGCLGKMICGLVQGHNNIIVECVLLDSNNGSVDWPRTTGRTTTTGTAVQCKRINDHDASMMLHWNSARPWPVWMVHPLFPLSRSHPYVLLVGRVCSLFSYLTANTLPLLVSPGPSLPKFGCYIIISARNQHKHSSSSVANLWLFWTDSYIFQGRRVS